MPRSKISRRVAERFLTFRKGIETAITKEVRLLFPTASQNEVKAVVVFATTVVFAASLTTHQG